MVNICTSDLYDSQLMYNITKSYSDLNRSEVLKIKCKN